MRLTPLWCPAYFGAGSYFFSTRAMFDPVLTWLLCMGPASWTSDASLVPGVIASSFCTTSAFLLKRHVRIAAGVLLSINGVTAVALLAVALAWLGTKGRNLGRKFRFKVSERAM